MLIINIAYTYTYIGIYIKTLTFYEILRVIKIIVFCHTKHNIFNHEGKRTLKSYWRDLLYVESCMAAHYVLIFHRLFTGSKFHESNGASLNFFVQLFDSTRRSKREESKINFLRYLPWIMVFIILFTGFWLWKCLMWPNAS